jgi:hypothetical protein
MALTPPRHIGFKGIWTEEKQQDWDKFKRKRQRDATERIIMISQSSMAYVNLVGNLIMNWFFPTTSTSSGFNVPSTAAAVLFCIPGRFAAPLLRRLVRDKPMLFGITFQLVLLLSLLARSLFFALSISDELKQHRTFCNSMIAFSSIVVSDLPLWVYSWIVAPAFLITRLSFHRLVGFWHVPMVVFGIMSAFLQTYLCTLLEGLRWQQF